MHKFAALLGFSLLALAVAGFGQQAGEAIVTGTVLDASHGPVHAAIVTLNHLATGAKFQVATDERGEYRTPPLRIGEYELRSKPRASGASTRAAWSWTSATYGESMRFWKWEKSHRRQ